MEYRRGAMSQMSEGDPLPRRTRSQKLTPHLYTPQEPSSHQSRPRELTARVRRLGFEARSSRRACAEKSICHVVR